MREPISLGKSLTTAKKSTAFLEDFDESFADYFLILIGCLHIIQNRFCQLFSVTFLQIFPEMSSQTVCKGVEAVHKIGMARKIIEAF